MKLSDLKAYLKNIDQLNILLPSGETVPSHFHITEVGEVTSHFIDCGGKVRRERVINLQLWSADDYDHRLHPDKFVHILEIAERELGIADLMIEVEYQGQDTIMKYGLDTNSGNLQLTPLQTDCLAKDKCGIPTNEKPKISLGELNKETTCSPGNGCC